MLAGVVAAAAWLVPESRPATRPIPLGQQVAITNTEAGLGSGAFGGGTADGWQWQLAVQDIADPGFPCLPGVSINGNDADPLFPDLDPLAQSPVGDPAFLAIGPELPGVGFAFIQVPADANRIWLDPVGGFQFLAAPTMVTACGEHFRLVGFAYPLTATLRIHASFTHHAGVSYTVPAALSVPRASLEGPQVDGVWQNADPAHGQVASGIIGSGRAAGGPWAIRVTFGTAGDCFSLSTSPPAGSTVGPQWQQACGPISTPQGPSTIMVLPLRSSRPGGQGVGYAVSVGAGTARLTAELSDGSNISAQPLVVSGRKYAAFFVPGPLRIFWLNWVDAAGRPIAGTTGLPRSGFMQFLPSGVPVMKTEAWSAGWAD